MKLIRTLVFMGALCISFSAHAGPFPKGSYQETCRNLDIEHRGSGYELRAECRTAGGSWNRTALDWNEATKCDGSIANMNGRLVCLAKEPGLPEGSYRESCDEIRVSGSVVYARCMSGRGRWHRTLIDLKQSGCTAGLANIDGRLECEPPKRDGGQ